MKVALFTMPYDAGVRGVRMGRGPLRLLEAGIVPRLEAAGHRVGHRPVEIADATLRPEPKTAFELLRILATGVKAARDEGAVPIVLAGTCYSSVGTVSGLGPERAGVFWFDSHGDFNTPETSLTGFLDGMSLAMLTGRCWAQLCAAVPGYAPVPERSVRLLAARDLDPLEAGSLAESKIERLSTDQVRGGLQATLDSLSREIDRAYVHVDLDVLDPSEGRANALAAPSGPTLDDVKRAIHDIGSRVPIGAVALTAYDPDLDEDGRICRAALELVDAALEVAGRSEA